MDQIGVGECKTHLAVWMDVRIISLRKQIQDRGGVVPIAEVDPVLLNPVIQGEIAGLAYDKRTGNVYTLPQHNPQQPLGGVPPRPPHFMTPPTHQEPSPSSAQFFPPQGTGGDNVWAPGGGIGAGGGGPWGRGGGPFADGLPQAYPAGPPRPIPTTMDDARRLAPGQTAPAGGPTSVGGRGLWGSAATAGGNGNGNGGGGWGLGAGIRGGGVDGYPGQQRDESVGRQYGANVGVQGAIGMESAQGGDGISGVGGGEHQRTQAQNTQGQSTAQYVQPPGVQNPQQRRTHLPPGGADDSKTGTGATDVAPQSRSATISKDPAAANPATITLAAKTGTNDSPNDNWSAKAAMPKPAVVSQMRMEDLLKPVPPGAPRKQAWAGPQPAVKESIASGQGQQQEAPSQIVPPPQGRENTASNATGSRLSVWKTKKAAAQPATAMPNSPKTKVNTGNGVPARASPSGGRPSRVRFWEAKGLPSGPNTAEGTGSVEPARRDSWYDDNEVEGAAVGAQGILSPRSEFFEKAKAMVDKGDDITAISPHQPRNVSRSKLYQAVSAAVLSPGSPEKVGDTERTSGIPNAVQHRGDGNDNDAAPRSTVASLPAPIIDSASIPTVQVSQVERALTPADASTPMGPSNTDTSAAATETSPAKAALDWTASATSADSPAAEPRNPAEKSVTAETPSLNNGRASTDVDPATSTIGRNCGCLLPAGQQTPSPKKASVTAPAAPVASVPTPTSTNTISSPESGAGEGGGQPADEICAVSPEEDGSEAGDNFLVVRNGDSLAQAIAALERSCASRKGGAASDAACAVSESPDAAVRLRKLLRGAGPVAFRLEGRRLGDPLGLVSTIQIAGWWRQALIFDVLTLGDCDDGKGILKEVLCPLLWDTKIRKVMHDCHDHVVALTHLFQGRGHVPTSMFDLQLAHEALNGNARNTFTEALYAQQACDDPSRDLSMDEEESLVRPLRASQLKIAAYGVLQLKKASKSAASLLVATGKLAQVFNASMMKFAFAFTGQRHGWRRAMFAASADTGTGCLMAGFSFGARMPVQAVGRELVSYELQKAGEARAKSCSAYGAFGFRRRDVSPTPDFAFAQPPLRVWSFESPPSSCHEQKDNIDVATNVEESVDGTELRENEQTAEVNISFGSLPSSNILHGPIHEECKPSSRQDSKDCNQGTTMADGGAETLSLGDAADAIDEGTAAAAAAIDNNATGTNGDVDRQEDGAALKGDTHSANNAKRDRNSQHSGNDANHGVTAQDAGNKHDNKLEDTSKKETRSQAMGGGAVQVGPAWEVGKGEEKEAKDNRAHPVDRKSFRIGGSIVIEIGEEEENVSCDADHGLPSVSPADHDKNISQHNKTPQSPEDTTCGKTVDKEESEIAESGNKSGNDKSEPVDGEDDDEDYSEDDGFGCESDVLDMLRFIPTPFLREQFTERENVRGLEEILLDVGTRPRALIQGRGKVYLCQDKSVLVTRYHIDCVVGRFEREGVIGSDNASGFPGLLHRVGVMRDKKGVVYGVTIRVGRYVKGCADMFDDLVFNIKPAIANQGQPRSPSILVIGPQGSGKTTLIRDICRKLSRFQSVVIVDTKNDIGGDSVIPHRLAIGESRRVMLADQAQQHSVMIQALRSHNPQTLVIDEISTEEEVTACIKIKKRGVRLVVGAVGNFPSILDSDSLGVALGGLEGIVDDGVDNSSEEVQKERRAAKPVFDVVIEVEGGHSRMHAVVKRVGAVVDSLLEHGRAPKPELRAPLPIQAAIDEGRVTGEEGESMHHRHASKGFLLKIAPDQSNQWWW